MFKEFRERMWERSKVKAEAKIEYLKKKYSIIDDRIDRLIMMTLMNNNGGKIDPMMFMLMNGGNFDPMLYMMMSKKNEDQQSGFNKNPSYAAPSFMNDFMKEMMTGTSFFNNKGSVKEEQKKSEKGDDLSKRDNYYINFIKECNILCASPKRFSKFITIDKNILDKIGAESGKLILDKIKKVVADDERLITKLIPFPIHLFSEKEIEFDPKDIEKNINLVLSDIMSPPFIKLTSEEKINNFIINDETTSISKIDYTNKYSLLLFLGLLRMSNEELYKSLNVTMDSIPNISIPNFDKK